MNMNKIAFWVSFVITLIIIGICIITYHGVFNGGLSDNSNDWIAFSTLVGSIGTMLFTGLNVVVFYMLTSTIDKRDRLYRIREQQISIVNKFHSGVQQLFHPNPEGVPSCECNSELFLRAIDWFQKIKRHKDILPTLNSKAYDDFIKDFQDFCKTYTYYGDDRTAFDGRNPQEIAYDIYCKARNIGFELLNDVDNLPQ